MAKNKPTKPTNLMPRSFGGEKNNFSDDLIASGFEANVPETYNGDNLNYQLNATGNELEYVESVVDYINAMPSNNVLTVNSNNQLDYLDASTLAVDNNVVHKTGEETISGAKTFNDTIVGSVNGNANTATNDIDGNPIKTTYQKTANISQSIDDSETKYPSNNAVKTALEQIIPSQVGNAGKYLKTNGTTTSWQNALDYKNITNCILEAPNGVLTYSGNVVTAKAGLKVLLVNGRNPDGTLNNIEYKLENDVSLSNIDYASEKRFVSINVEGNLNFDDRNNFVISNAEPTNKYDFLCWYNPRTNVLKQWLNNTWVDIPRAFLGWFSATTSTITNLVCNDLGVRLYKNDVLSNTHISCLGMPSQKHTDLTLGASGSTYTAPANGYFYVSKIANSTLISDFKFVSLRNNNSGIESLNNGSYQFALNCCVAVKKGDIVICNYNATGDTNAFRFVYAEGEVS